MTRKHLELERHWPSITRDWFNIEQQQHRVVPGIDQELQHLESGGSAPLSSQRQRRATVSQIALVYDVDRDRYGVVRRVDVGIVDVVAIVVDRRTTTSDDRLLGLERLGLDALEHVGRVLGVDAEVAAVRLVLEESLHHREVARPDGLEQRRVGAWVHLEAVGDAQARRRVGDGRRRRCVEWRAW